MNFRKLFPASSWLLRQLTSPTTWRISIYILAFVLIPATALRIEALIFEYRVHKLMSGLATLRIGVTSEAEALSKIPELRKVRRTSDDYRCGADDCPISGLSCRAQSDF